MYLHFFTAALQPLNLLFTIIHRFFGGLNRLPSKTLEKWPLPGANGQRFAGEGVGQRQGDGA